MKLGATGRGMRCDGKKAHWTINPCLIARAHTGGTWAYSRHTEGKKKMQFEHKVGMLPMVMTRTDLDFLLTTGHTACLAASVFWTSALRGF
jgi:hypothetical protein